MQGILFAVQARLRVVEARVRVIALIFPLNFTNDSLSMIDFGSATVSGQCITFTKAHVGILLEEHVELVVWDRERFSTL